MRSPLGELSRVVHNITTLPVPFAPQAASFRSLFTGAAAEQSTAIDTYGAVGTLFNVVSTLSNSAGSVQWKLWRSSPDGDPDARTPVTKHQALAVWNRPNDFMSGMRFRESQFQHTDLCGEACWLVVRDRRATFPIGLWPVRPDRIEPVPDLVRFLAGYIYTSPDGERIPLNVDDLIRPMMPNPSDPYRGMGPVQALLNDLDAERYSATWNRNFFLNSAEPGGVIEVPEGLDDSDFRRLQRRWNEQHRGVRSAHRVAILEAGMKWVDRSFSQRDMQFAELRKVGQEMIRRGFGFPDFAAGEVADVNRATAEASDRWFDKHLTMPRLDRVRDVLNHDFLPMFGSTGVGVEFDYVSPTGKDDSADADLALARGKALQALVDAGVDPDSAASAVGMPELKFIGPPVRTRPVPALPPADVPAQLEPAPQAPPALEPAAITPRIVRGELVPAPVPDGDDDSDADTTHLDGCMIALMPRPQDAARMALPGGELAGDLHCTLVYLGPDATAWPQPARDAVVDGVSAWFGGLAPVSAQAFGAAFWNPTGDKPCWVWSLTDDQDAYGLSLVPARAIAHAAAEDVAGLFLPVQHTPWAAHMAAVYGADPGALTALTERCGPVIFDRVRVSFGDVDVDIPLTPDAGPELGDVAYARATATLEAAQRWVVKAHLDDNTCGPCRAQDGRLYRNRESAYADYPGGSSYVHCLGQEHGHQCRCRVVKRGRKGE